MCFINSAPCYGGYISEAVSALFSHRSMLRLIVAQANPDLKKSLYLSRPATHHEGVVGAMKTPARMPLHQHFMQPALPRHPTDPISKC